MSKTGNLFLGILFFIVLLACNQPKANKDSRLALVEEGEKLFQSSICFQCHSLKGQKMYGPALNSLLNKSVNVIRNGDTLSVIADRKYLLRSIKNPDFEKVLGFEKSTMPAPTLSEKQLNAVLEYLIVINEQEVNQQ